MEIPIYTMTVAVIRSRQGRKTGMVLETENTRFDCEDTIFTEKAL